ncbi:MAG: CHAT domain-containing protein [bacterium]
MNKKSNIKKGIIISLLTGIIAISFVSIVWFRISAAVDVPPIIKSTSPDSLRAFSLKPNMQSFIKEWESFQKGGEQDSLHNLIRNNYVVAQSTGLLLLEQATLFRHRGKQDIANAKIITTREIAEDLIAVFQDSYLLKQVIHIETLDDKQLQRRALASELYAAASQKLHDGDRVESKKRFISARNLASKANDEKLQVEALSFLQWFLGTERNHTKVIELGEQIIKLASKSGYKRRLAIALQQNAEALRELDRDEQAIVTIDKAIQIAKLLNDEYVLANCYLIKAQIYNRRHEYQKALNMHEKAAAVKREGIWLGTIDLYEGQIFTHLGEYGKAQNAFERAIEIFKQHGQRAKTNLAVALSSLSDLYFRMGEYEAALNYEKISLEIKTGNERRALSLSLLGLKYSKLDSIDQALSAHQESLKLWPKSGGTRHPTDFWLRLGDVYLKTGNFPKAKDTFSEALKLAEPIEYRLGKGGALLGFGRLAIIQNEMDKAKTYFEDALAISQDIGEPLLKAAAFYGLANIEKKANNWQAALTFIDNAISTIEALRSTIHQDSLRVSFFATNQELYDDAILISSAQNLENVALQYAEKARARSLFDAIGQFNIKVMAQSQKDLVQTPIPAFEQMQQKIPDSVQIIEYRVTADTLIIWLLSRDDTPRLRKVPVSIQQLEQKVEKYLVSIGAEELKAFRKRVSKNIAAVYEENKKLGKQLYDLLIKPIEEAIVQDNRLIILPDGVLHRLPFGALVTNEDSFFDERYVWTKAPSLSILAETQMWQDKIVQPQKPKFLMVAGDFPSKKSQIKTVKSLFEHATILENRSANYNNLKNHLKQGSEIVYFSIHAVADESHPMNSFIELYDETHTSGDNSWKEVYARQLLQLDFSRTWLTVLNACETSRGKIAKGEGALNMVRIFSISRVPVVVASLWKNDDYASANIISNFFKNLIAGQSTTDAWHQAKILSIQQLLKTSGYALPYFWAALEIYQNSWFNPESFITKK